MLVIRDVDFEMEQVKTTPFFDLKLLTVVNEGKSNERYEMKLDGYSKSFKSCIETIITKRLTSKNISVSINGYLELYEKELQKLIDSEVTIENIEDKKEDIEIDEEED